MGLSTSYSKAESDIQLTRLKQLFGSGLHEKPLKISDPTPTALGGYVLSDVGTYSFGTTEPGKWNVGFLSTSGWEIVDIDLSNNLQLDVSDGALAYNTFLEVAGVPANPSVTVYDGDDFTVTGGYGDEGNGVMTWHPDYTGSRSTSKIYVSQGGIIEVTSMTNNVSLPIKIPILTVLDTDQSTILDFVIVDVANTIQTRSYTASQNCYVVASVANVSYLSQCELSIQTFAGFSEPTKILTAENYTDFLVEKTLKERIVNGDTPSEVQGLTSQRNEANIIQFKGETLFLWSEGWNNSVIKVGDYNVDTNTVSNITTAIDSTISGISAPIFKCPTTFVLNQKVYLVISVWNPDYCVLYESSDGRNFTEVSRTLANISGFSTFGNHWIIPEKINDYYYWYIEGNVAGTWQMKLLRSTQINTGWEVVGTVQGLSGTTGAKGGPCVYYQNGKFKMVYHYGPTSGNLPTYIAYAEADVNDPLYFKPFYLPLLSITHTPFGNLTDQFADPELCEIDGKTYLFCSVVDNTTPRATIYRWECDGRLFDILNSKI